MILCMPDSKSAISVLVALMSMFAEVAVARLADIWMSGKVPGTKVAAVMTAGMTAAWTAGMMTDTRPEIQIAMMLPTELVAAVWLWEMHGTGWTDFFCRSRWSSRARRVRLASQLVL